MHHLYKKINKTSFYTLVGVCFYVTIPLLSNIAHADLAQDLQNKIDSTSAQIQKLQEEIRIYSTSLNKTAEQAASLKNELNALNTSKKKLETELKLTNKNLDKTTKTITSLSDQIRITEENINKKRDTIASALIEMRDVESVSVLENFLGSDSITEASKYIEQTEQISNKLRNEIRSLSALDIMLGGQKKDQEAKKSELKKLQSELSSQQKAVADTAKQKDKVLTETKNQESTYQAILKEKQALKEAFEKDLFKFESELKIAIDPSKLPSRKSGVLSWPLDKISLTQQFGKTSSSGRLYASGTHNGVDFRASDGTRVMASLSGKVTATGNTDLKKGCYSYGKWILINHNNGLSTLYAHLSSISVKPDDTVVTGDVIGYSGRTGYVTGPHLHLTVLATEGLRVTQIPTATACNGVTIPIGTPQAFLDPLLYLP